MCRVSSPAVWAHPSRSCASTRPAAIAASTSFLRSGIPARPSRCSAARCPTSAQPTTQPSGRPHGQGDADLAQRRRARRRSEASGHRRRGCRRPSARAAPAARLSWPRCSSFVSSRPSLGCLASRPGQPICCASPASTAPLAGPPPSPPIARQTPPPSLAASSLCQKRTRRIRSARAHRRSRSSITRGWGYSPPAATLAERRTYSAACSSMGNWTWRTSSSAS